MKESELGLLIISESACLPKHQSISQSSEKHLSE